MQTQVHQSLESNLSDKNQNPLSMEAKQTIIDRDIAHNEAKNNPSIENSRIYKNLRNQTNRIITQERKIRKRQIFADNKSMKQMWKTSKDETGQNNHTTPTHIKEWK